MGERRFLYYITDRSQFPGDERARCRALLDKIAEAVWAGVDYIQLREKDLSIRDLEQLACEVVSLIQQLRMENLELRTRLLINSRTDVALAVGADGVHLRSNDVLVSDVRLVVRHAEHCRHPEKNEKFVIAVSRHTAAEVVRAESEGADFVVFAPVFEKKDVPGTAPQGLAALREACGAGIPVLALGGVTLENAAACLEAGAAGIAGIRLFQENKISDVVGALRESGRF
jgi:thiamine-phosphate pyrophosphorylase